MRLPRWIISAIGLALSALSLGPLTAGAGANTGGIIAPSDPQNPTVNSGWQAGTCTVDAPTTCSVDTPGQFFEQAAGHPPVGFTQFIVKHTTTVPGVIEKPEGELKTVRVDLPVGLSVNPGATQRCDLATFEASAASCDPLSQVGTSFVTAADPVLGAIAPQLQAAVYNIKPPAGEPARFGLELLGKEIFLQADVAWSGDYHEGFTIAVPKALELPGLEGVILKNRLVFDGIAGDGTFITTPSTCLGEAFPGPSGHLYSTYLLAASYAEEASPGYQFPQSAEPTFESPIPPGTSPKECETIPYGPSLAVNPGTALTDSPAGATVDVDVPHILGKNNQDSSDTRTAQVSLPAGMGLNPSAANGLQTCTDAQFRKQSSAPGTDCPAASKVGTVTIESPPLPEGSLTGPVYVGQQLSRDPASGQEYRVFVDAESSRYGISVRLVGNVSANPVTGQLTTTFADTPQVPFSSFELDFDGGARAVLSSPPVCASEATSRFTPWSANASATPSGPVVLSAAPGGGACAKTLAERPFSPGFKAAPKSNNALAFTPFTLNITRGDGQQELKGVDITLAPGATAKLAGVPYCPPAAIAAAAARAGAAENADASCPDKSQIGVATIAAGTGPSPLQIGGKAFLAGPYKGAPLSLVVITPGVAGPFDLGTVVVRVPLFLDPETAQIHAVSDAIPDVFGGAKLDIRSIAVNVNKDDFTLNGTNCSKLATAGALKGGGADPTNPAAFSSFPVSAPVQLDNCAPLGFHPKLNLRLFGATRRAKHPRLRAVLKTHSDDANMARVSVALPHALFLDQASLGQICTRVQFAANDCPKQSVYGNARAITPLLGQPLEGPVYLRSSNNTLPDLVAHLQGQVDVDLVGRIDSFKGGIRTTFDRVPDVPVSKFTMTLPGGKHGLLVASRNLCKGKVKAIVQIKGQNGKKANKRSKLKTPCGKKSKPKKGHHRK